MLDSGSYLAAFYSEMCTECAVNSQLYHSQLEQDRRHFNQDLTKKKEQTTKGQRHPNKTPEPNTVHTLRKHVHLVIISHSQSP